MFHQRRGRCYFPWLHMCTTIVHSNTKTNLHVLITLAKDDQILHCFFIDQRKLDGWYCACRWPRTYCDMFFMINETCSLLAFSSTKDYICYDFSSKFNWHFLHAKTFYFISRIYCTKALALRNMFSYASIPMYSQTSL